MKAPARAAAWLYALSVLASGARVGLYGEPPGSRGVIPSPAPPARGTEPGPSLSAVEAAAMAVAGDQGLRAEREALELRAGAWKLGFRAYLPALELNAGSDERLAVYGPDSSSVTLSANLSQTLWDGGRLRAARALEAAELALARAELDRKAEATGEAAVSAYRSVVSARARLSIKRAALGSADAERVLLEAEVGLGLAKASDSMEAGLRLKSLELEIAEAELELSIAEEELARTLGAAILPELSDSPRQGLEGFHIEADDIADLAAARSPELVLARHAVAEKRARARAAAFSWLPTVSLKASGQVSGSRLPLTRATWSLGLSLDFAGPYAGGSAGASGGLESIRDTSARSSLSLRPIPDPARALDRRSAELELRVAEERYAAERAKVALSARSAVEGYRHALGRRTLAAEALALSELAVTVTRARVALGKAVRTEAVSAELRRAAGEIDLLDAAGGLVAAERRLERLLGIPPDSLALFLEAAVAAEPVP